MSQKKFILKTTRKSKFWILVKLKWYKN